MAEDRPTAAHTLATVGVALQAVGAATSTYILFSGWGGGYWFPGMMMGPMMMGRPWPLNSTWLLVLVVVAVAVVALGVAGVLWMSSSDPSKVRGGSTLVLVASVIAFPTMFGFIVGSLLMFIGAILGLTWQPAAPRGGP